MCKCLKYRQVEALERIACALESKPNPEPDECEDDTLWQINHNVKWLIDKVQEQSDEISNLQDEVHRLGDLLEPPPGPASVRWHVGTPESETS